METLCTKIQEEIAWGKVLSSIDQEHILNCSSCSHIALEFSNIESLLDGYLGVEIPERFTDQVMAKISNQSKSNLLFLFNFNSIRLNFVYFWGIAVVLFGFLLPSAR